MLSRADLIPFPRLFDFGFFSREGNNDKGQEQKK